VNKDSTTLASAALDIIRDYRTCEFTFRFTPDGGSRRFLEEADLTDGDRDKIASGNWDRLCAGIGR